jgi:dTDP-4-dehydrorhamnose reductase
MLGRAFCRRLEELERPFLALSRAQCDLRYDEQLLRAVDSGSLVVNCAAYTNVDGAEADEATATRVNGEAVGVLAGACRKAGVPLVHFSTDYVFDGASSTPYRIDHTRAPLGAYGRSKAVGERLLEASGAEFLLVRTSWVYSAWGNNFVRTMAKLMSTRPSVQVVADQRGRPSEAEALAKNTLRLVDAGKRGIFHVTDAGECSWFEFARAIARAIGSTAEVNPCTTKEFPRPAPRPGYSVLDISETERVLGPLVPFEAQLERISETLRREFASA